MEHVSLVPGQTEVTTASTQPYRRVLSVCRARQRRWATNYANTVVRLWEMRPSARWRSKGLGLLFPPFTKSKQCLTCRRSHQPLEGLLSAEPLVARCILKTRRRSVSTGATEQMGRKIGARGESWLEPEAVRHVQRSHPTNTVVPIQTKECTPRPCLGKHGTGRSFYLADPQTGKNCAPSTRTSRPALSSGTSSTRGLERECPCPWTPVPLAVLARQRFQGMWPATGWGTWGPVEESSHLTDQATRGDYEHQIPASSVLE